MTTEQNPILIETIKGKDYFHRENDLHELIFWDYTATKRYSHLGVAPFQEEWEHEDAEENGEDTFRDMEIINLPILLDDNGDELEIEQVIELYEIEPKHIAGSGRFIDGDEVECFHWTNGEREEKPFSQDIN